MYMSQSKHRRPYVNQLAFLFRIPRVPKCNVRLKEPANPARHLVRDQEKNPFVPSFIVHDDDSSLRALTPCHSSTLVAPAGRGIHPSIVGCDSW
ncbi:hypothetical protein FJTKL_02903 [Diaporthe vaccinii]|uniref:Uncharacterized protein n=1 Tax=Diaporthe vaccinii TaxID=105482 RepID=A0ABR4F334_9PEZI